MGHDEYLLRLFGFDNKTSIVLDSGFKLSSFFATASLVCLKFQEPAEAHGRDMD